MQISGGRPVMKPGALGAALATTNVVAWFVAIGVISWDAVARL